jgi:O-antigen ligase
LYLAILSYFGALLLSTIFGIDPMRSWWGNQERMNGLFTLLHFLAWLTMAVGLLKTWADWKRLLNYQVVLSAIMALIAMMQKANPNLLMFPAGPRVGGLLDNPIYMAAYQIFNLFFLALLFWRVPSRNARIVYVIIGFLDIIAFILAQSRGALVGLGAGIVAFALYVGIFSPSKKTKKVVFGGLAVLMLAYGALYAFRDVPFIATSPLARLTNFNATVSTRLIAWKIAWAGFLDRPITGWGLDNFHIIFNAKFNPESLRFGQYETWFDRSHNTVLDVLSMTGILGFITFFAMYGAIFYSTWHAYRKKWIDLPIAAILFSLPIAYFVQNLFVFDHPAGFSMSFLLFGLIIAATKGEFVGERDPETVKAVKTEGHRDAPLIMFTVIQLLAVFLVYRTSYLPFEASRISLQGNSVFSFNPAMAYNYAKTASEIPTMYKDEQSFLLSRNVISVVAGGQFNRIPQWQEIYALAKALCEEEVRRHPNNTHPLYIYARLAQEILPLIPSESATALEMYKRAIASSPKRQQLHYGLARLYLQLGQLDNAIQVFKDVRDFDPDNGMGSWNYGLTLMYDKAAQTNDESIRLEGAKEIKKAIEAPFPYALLSSRELMPLFDAFIMLKDADGLGRVVDQLTKSQYPVADTATYAQLALKMHLVGLEALAVKILAFAETVAPGTNEAYNKLLNPAPPIAPEPPVLGEGTQTLEATTRTTSGVGPRR